MRAWGKKGGLLGSWLRPIEAKKKPPNEWELLEPDGGRVGEKNQMRGEGGQNQKLQPFKSQYRCSSEFLCRSNSTNCIKDLK